MVRIERVTDIAEMMKCLPFERELRKKGRDNNRESNLLLFLQSQVNNPIFGFFMAYDEQDNVIGYIVAILNLFPGNERIFFLRFHAKSKELQDQFKDVIGEWVKPFKIKTATVTVQEQRMVKAFKRKYGYHVTSVNMERRYW